MLKELDTLQGIIQEGVVFQCGLTEPSTRHRRLGFRNPPASADQHILSHLPALFLHVVYTAKPCS